MYFQTTGFGEFRSNMWRVFVTTQRRDGQVWHLRKRWTDEQINYSKGTTTCLRAIWQYNVILVQICDTKLKPKSN